MGRVVVCRQLPCKIYPVVHAATPPWLERAAPFIVGIFILLVSVATTHQVIKQTKEYILRKWTSEELASIAPHLSPETQFLGLPWVVDAAQIPALLGTPLVGLFILKPINYVALIVIYTGVLAIGLLIFFYFIQKVPVIDYEDLGLDVLGYRISLVVLGGIGLNLACAVVAAVVVT
jgi:hypothetical protein